MEKVINAISLEESYEYVCECGNTEMAAGFYPCDINGNLVEPDNDWEGYYRCEQCGALHYIKE